MWFTELSVTGSCLRKKGRKRHGQDKKIPFQYRSVDTSALVIPLPNALQRGWLLSLGWDEHTTLPHLQLNNTLMGKSEQ